MIDRKRDKLEINLVYLLDEPGASGYLEELRILKITSDGEYALGSTKEIPRLWFHISRFMPRLGPVVGEYVLVKPRLGKAKYVYREYIY